MPLYLDRHDIPGVTAEALAEAHLLDLETEQAFGVRYLTYFFEPDAGSVFCLAEGPNKQAVEDVHREAHGLVASTIIEVEPGPLQAFFGPLPTHAPGEVFVDRAVRAVLFTDICGSTELTQTHGDEVSTALVREHDEIVRTSLGGCDGREVKHTGDGIMASFASVSAAVECAIGIQRALAVRNDTATVPVNLRIGISAGEPIAQGDDLFGAAVQLAARLCAHAAPGAITASIAVRELCIGKQLQFRDLGPATLKGFAEPTQVFEVLWT